jgi:membrane protease YdiL (CAAX protease family)
VLLIIAIPLTLVEPNGDTTLPVGGNGFGSLYKISWVLLLAYTYSYIRKLDDVGFYPTFKLRFLGIAILSWLSFVTFVFIIAFSLGFLNPSPFSEIIKDGFSTSLLEIMRIWIGTALFEELFFRGLLQNMLSQQINRAKAWKTYWIYGLIIVLVLSILAGYALAIEYIWFPVAVTFALFLMAYYLENKSYQALGTYTALAIISMVFGLAHFHKDSIIFVGLAALAGWAYGYTYLKTKNVFYAALVHTLVNFSQFFFLLKQIK